MNTVGGVSSFFPFLLKIKNIKSFLEECQSVFYKRLELAVNSDSTLVSLQLF